MPDEVVPSTLVTVVDGLSGFAVELEDEGDGVGVGVGEAVGPVTD